MSQNEQRRLLDYLRQFNSTHLSKHTDNTDLAARISSYELAYKMQSAAPETVIWIVNQNTSRHFTESMRKRLRNLEQNVFWQGDW